MDSVSVPKKHSAQNWSASGAGLSSRGKRELPWIGAGGSLPRDPDTKAESSLSFYTEAAEAQGKSAPFPSGAVRFDLHLSDSHEASSSPRDGQPPTRWWMGPGL